MDGMDYLATSGYIGNCRFGLKFLPRKLTTLQLCIEWMLVHLRLRKIEIEDITFNSMEIVDFFYQYLAVSILDNELTFSIDQDLKKLS